jgi:serine/threonine protein kinase
MAIVYLARQESLNRDVALKELSAFYASAPDMAQRFLQESQLAGALNHPNIVTVLEYFEEGGVPYIAMEYVRRGSLRPYVGKLSVAQLVGVLEGVLAALAHAETHGIVHRDLKPENLMVTADGRVKITDFGIAKATQSAGTGQFLTAPGTTVGTPTYMAPEQAMGRDIGIWTDLYSVGIMTWENVVGRTPFHDSDVPLVILTRQLNEIIPPAVELNPDANPDLSAWIERLLIKDPADRARSPAAAWDELEEIIIAMLGPRWRRDARLPSPSQIFETPHPLTPAPFESQKVRTPDAPASTPEPAVSTPEPQVSTPEPQVSTPEPQVSTPEPAVATPAAHDEAPGLAAEAGYVTFGAAAEAAVATPPAVEAAPATPPATDAPVPTPPPTPEVPAPTRSDEPVSPRSTYITFGRTPEPPPPTEPAPPVEPAPVEEPEPATEPREAEPVAAAEAPVEALTAAPLQAWPTPEPEPAAAVPAAAAAPEAERIGTQERPRTPPGTIARRRGVALAGLGIVAAAIVGFLVAPSSSPHAAPPPPFRSSASSNAVSVSLPEGWHQIQPPATPGLSLANAVAVSPPSPQAGTLVTGTSTTSDPSLLPRSLLSLVGTPREQQVVTLGGQQFFRYPGLSPGGSPETVYALPTKTGTVIAACLLGGSQPDFAGECDRVLSKLSVLGGTSIPLGPSSKLAAQLSGAITGLDDAARTGETTLRSAAKPAAQAAAAGQLATAYDQAANALQNTSASPAETSTVKTLADALGKIGTDYKSLSTAATQNNSGKYNEARQAVATDSNTAATAMARLKEFGYSSG